MKIVFICSSLEPGKDGVGDYTRRLAAELIKQENNTAIVSVNDKYVNELFSGVQWSDGVDITVLRLPSAWPLRVRADRAKHWIEQANPDWLSLQYVPFGFHPKGLCVGLSKFLLTLGGDRQWHIMFHELWVGIALEESKKLIWWGCLQRFLIKTLISNLKAKVIHTQTKLYGGLLEKLGTESAYLPLFGNIPVMQHALKKSNINLSANKEISLVVFGSIHAGAPIADFAKEAVTYSKKNNVTIKLIFIGRCGPEQERWSTIWKSEGLPMEMLGEQPAETVSTILLNSTMGISATAIAVIEKSGSFAAMRDHGLPVISLSKPWTPRGMPSQKIALGIVEYRKGNFEQCLADLRHVNYGHNVSEIAYELVNALSAISG
jgi:hypothetical protein